MCEMCKHIDDQDKLREHRMKAKITCPENCWCWDLEAEINSTHKGD